MSNRMKFNLSLVTWLCIACALYMSAVFGFLMLLEIKYLFWILFVLMATPAVVISESIVRRCWK